MSDRTGINWHQGLRLGAFKRRYRRFRDSQQINSHGLEPEVYELPDGWCGERRPNDWDPQYDWDFDDYYDDYWNPFNPDEYVAGYREHLIRNLDMVLLNRLDIAGVLGHTTKIIKPGAATRQDMTTVPTYSPKELPRLLLNYLSIINECNDLERVYPTLQKALRGVTQDDIQTLARIAAALHDPYSLESVHSSLVAMLLLAPFWVRPPSGWTLNSSAKDEIILSLVDHLFVIYPVPRFLYRNWLTERDLPTNKWMFWFILLGQGANLHQATRHFREWVIPKTFVRYLYQAPSDLTPLLACMWAEVHRLGGSEVEFQRLRWQENYLWDPTSKHEQALRYQSFWRDTVRWLTRHREELTDQMSQLILEWASHMFGMDQRGPFTLRHRSPQNACEAAERFLETRKNPLVSKWRSHGWDWEYVGQNGDVWVIRELKTGYELREEGTAMHHCVESYTSRCSIGLDSIFSLTVNGERRLTIQVNPNRKIILQARGYQNRATTPEESMILNVWQKEVLDS